MEGVPDTEYVQALLDKFEEETGATVNIEVLNYALMHEKLVPQLTAAKGTGSYDLIVVDNYWVAEFNRAGWLMALDEKIAASDKVNTDVYLPSMMEMVGKYEGKIYMLPFYNYAMALVYRDDIFSDPAIQAEYKARFGKDLALPTTIPEYVELAEFMTRDTNGDGEVDVFGASMQGLRPDPTAMEFLNYLYSMGGQLYDTDGNVVLTQDVGVQALNYYVQNMKTAAPPGAPSYGFDEAFATVAQGKAFSYITYNWMVPVLDNPEQSQVVGKMKVTAVPGGVGLLGGWGWAIPNSSANPNAAWAFIEWVESFEIAKERALMGGAPTRTDVFRDADVLAKYPHYKDVEKIVGDSIMFPMQSRAPQIVEVLGRVISETIAGSMTADAAIQELIAESNNLADK
ncbi:MAG: sugar ABC transporter substrate-binding protein [Chloroflexi bacterium]|nr:ABC transporter substrate-binding protein [Anaerolinea sp.]TDA66880.1 MAG: sugar ABC transporter substrate-binding protein [Chloroflexota bacterium]